MILYDRLIPPEALAGARADAEVRYVGKQGGGPSVDQAEIARLLLEHARAGRLVVRLKGGDPFVFGRGGEEALALRAAGIDFEVVPGVTAGVAAAAYAGIPVTHRGLASAVAFVTAHEDPAKDETIDWDALAAFPGTLVFYMGVRQLPRVTQRLIAGGRNPDEPAAVIEHGTYPDQRTVLATLATIAARRGRSGGARARTDRERRGRSPRGGSRLASRRAARRANHRGHARARSGERARGSASCARRARHRAAGDPDRRTPAGGPGARRLRPAVPDQHERRPAPFRAPRRAGPRRARTRRPADRGDRRRHGRGARARAGSSRTWSQIASSPRVCSKRSPAVRRCAARIVARAASARDTLVAGLRALGAEVEVLTLYDTVAEPLDEAGVTALAAADYVTFTSSSTVRFLLEQARPGTRTRLVSIGPVTSATLREQGLEPHVEATRHDIPGLLDALLADAVARDMSRPVITFLSDYGLADEFVGVCHAVIARRAPDARVIDLTHGDRAPRRPRGGARAAGGAALLPARGGSSRGRRSRRRRRAARARAALARGRSRPHRPRQRAAVAGGAGARRRQRGIRHRPLGGANRADVARPSTAATCSRRWLARCAPESHCASSGARSRPPRSWRSTCRSRAGMAAR